MKIALAAEGGYFEDRSLKVELHWGRGGGERVTAEVPDAAVESNANLAAAIKRGQVVVIDAAMPKAPTRRAPRVAAKRPKA